MKKPNFAAMNPVVAEAIQQIMAEQGDKFSLEEIFHLLDGNLGLFQIKGWPVTFGNI